MKTLILTTLLLASSAFAQMDPMASLGSVMKAMNNDLKKIVAQAADATKNASSAELAADFVKQSELAKKFIPDSVKTLPADQRPARETLYLKMMDDDIQLGKDLENAFRNNDNTAAAELLKKLSSLKKEGHAEFR